MNLTDMQELALRWLAIGVCPTWYGGPSLSTLVALEAHGLMHWKPCGTSTAACAYWVTPPGGTQALYGPTLSAKGEAVARRLWHWEYA